MAATKTVSIVTGGTNNATTTAAEINNIATDFIANGVVGAIALNTGSGGTGSFAPNAQGTPGMSIRISSGQGYVSATPTGGTSQRVRFAADTFEDVTITANATGGTRYDWIYAQIDATKLANPGVNKDDVFTYVASRSTSSATDNGTPPTYGYNIGYVTVANGASSITNSNITDSRVITGPTTLPQGTATTTGMNMVTAQNLATTAITLGYAQITSAFDTASATAVQVTSLTATVTIPAGSRRVLIMAYCPSVSSSAASSVEKVTIWDGTVASGTQVGQGQTVNVAADKTNGNALTVMASVTPSSGSKTYNIGLQTNGGTAEINCSSTAPAFIWVGVV